MFAKPGGFALVSSVFYRSLVAGIILFWLWMTALLVRATWFPQNSEPIEVPVAYVWKLLFLHEEASDLTLYNQRERLGNLRLQPRREMVWRDGVNRTERSLKAVGGFGLNLPWAGRQSVILHGNLELGERDEVRQIRLSAALHDAQPNTPGTTVVLEGSPGTDQWHYVVQRGGEMVEDRAGTVAQLLDRPEWRAFGLDPANLVRLQRQQAGQLAVTARHGKLRLNRDEIDTYVVNIRDANGLESTIHVNQLGQVLAVKTSAGISLLDVALSP